MDIQSRKILIVQEVLKLKNENVVKDLEAYIKQKTASSSKSHFEPMSMEQFNSEIEQSLNDIANGRVVDLAKLKKDIQEWD